MVTDEDIDIIVLGIPPVGTARPDTWMPQNAPVILKSSPEARIQPPVFRVIVLRDYEFVAVCELAKRI